MSVTRIISHWIPGSAAIAALAICASVLAAPLNAADTKEVQKTVPLNFAGAVSLTAVNGSIRISTWDRSDVDVHAIIEAASGSSCDRRLYDATSVNIDPSPDSVQIVTDTPNSNLCNRNGESRLPGVHYTIQIPRTARLTIRDHNSDTEIVNLQTGIDIETHNGAIRAEGLAGSARIVTHNGDVRIDFAEFSADSSIRADHGTIDLSLPGNSRFALHAGLDRHGSMTSDFPVATTLSTRRSEFVNGSVNGGGPTLALAIGHGFVHLRAK